METIRINTSQHVGINYPVAGLGERIAARLIDLALFFGLYILFILLGIVTAIINEGIFFYILIAVYFGSFVFYNLLCEIFMNGQSIGKRLMKIKVISLDGSQASIGQYTIRWLFRLVDFYLTGQVGGLVCVAVSKNKQRIGDVVANTTVIKTTIQTKLSHVAFHPVEETYIPVFNQAAQLRDQDIELIHEVLNTYYKTFSPELIYTTSDQVQSLLSIHRPSDMNQLLFLQTIIKDYNYLTSVQY